MKAAIRILFVALFGIAMSFAGVIDNFSVSQGLISDETADSIAVTSTQGNRTIWTSRTGGFGSTSIEIDGGFYFGSIGAQAIGDSGVIYDGFWDLTAANATGLTLDVVSVEKYVAGALTFFVTQGANTATYTLTVPAPGTVTAEFASFTGIGSVNLAAVDKLGFTFNHVMAQDIVLDNFSTQVIPEPATYALMACGLLGLALVRRRS